MLPVAPFRSFQRVDLLLCLSIHAYGHVSCHVAVAVFPFQTWIRAVGAVSSGGELGSTVASSAGINYFKASSTDVRTSRLGHKRAFGPLANRRANHDFHLFKKLFCSKKKAGSAPAFKLNLNER
jgi:hypothetical protein